jgi:AraC-like DNA-binding protein
LRRVLSASEFLADPVGGYCAGRRHCVFAHSPRLLGFASWGRPDVEDVRELLRLCEVGLKPECAPYRWLVDIRGLELVEPATFGLFLEYTRKNREVLRKNVVRQAQLRPDGIVGAVVSGFAHVARLPYPDRVFGDAEEALAWLEVEHDAGVRLLAELDAIRDEARESFAVVARLRRELELSGPATSDALARRLGLSMRSLQRALREAGTTYRLELKDYRIRRAQELLLGERPLSWIAGEVGFSSAQHFATAYRQAVGETPSTWRTRHRASQG